MSDIFYCTREDVKTALDIAYSPSLNKQIDRAIKAATRTIEDDLLNRKFYPEIATRYFDWPDNLQYADSWRLWVDSEDLISLTSLTVDGTAVDSANYILRPENYGPPFNRIELDRTTSTSFSGNPQQNIAAAGLWGYDNNVEDATTLNGDINSSVTSLAIDDSSAVGVGNILYMGTERLLVTEKAMVDTTQDLQSALTAAKSDVTVAVSDGTGFTVGEILLLDSERMLITDIAGNNLTVQRAYDGTILAAHTSPSIYAPRTCTVTRGALGTTAASHTNGDTVQVQVIHPLVHSLAIAESINTLEQERSGYARTVGSGDNTRNASGAGLESIRKRAIGALALKARTQAI